MARRAFRVSTDTAVAVPVDSRAGHVRSMWTSVGSPPERPVKTEGSVVMSTADMSAPVPRDIWVIGVNLYTFLVLQILVLIVDYA